MEVGQVLQPLIYVLFISCWHVLLCISSVFSQKRTSQLNQIVSDTRCSYFCVQNVPTCCWPTMHRWRWRMLRDGAPLLRPSATETDKWVSVCDLLAGIVRSRSETELRNSTRAPQINVSSVGSVRAFLCDQQMQINSCLCTFCHAVAS